MGKMIETNMSEKKRICGLGIVFDIDALGGGSYGEKARDIISTNLDMCQLANCSVFAGDTEATLQLKSRDYVIAFVGPFDPTAVKKALRNKAKSFLRGEELKSEPLCNIGYITEVGVFKEVIYDE